MKNIAVSLLIVACFTVVPAMAMTPEEASKAHFQEVKKIKDAQRVSRETEKKNPSVQSKWKGFWAKEGERSGLSGSGSGFGKFAQSLNPMPFLKEEQEKYKARKSAKK